MIARTALGSRHFQTRLKPVSGWPPLVALIDLMFLLLLFFVLATSFVRVSGIQVDLPRVQGGSVVDMERYVVTVVPSDRKDLNKPALVYFNDRPVTLEQLKQPFRYGHRYGGQGCAAGRFCRNHGDCRKCPVGSLSAHGCSGRKKYQYLSPVRGCHGEEKCIQKG